MGVSAPVEPGGIATGKEASAFISCRGSRVTLYAEDIMLTEEERDAVKAAAQNGETGFALELMRAFARTGRIEELPQIVAVFADNVEINRVPVRNYLAHRVPAILVNHYFPAVLALHQRPTGSAYQGFIRYTLDHKGWEEPIVRAIIEGNASNLTAAIDEIFAQQGLDYVLEGRAEPPTIR
jgi:hypothetical protein